MEEWEGSKTINPNKMIDFCLRDIMICSIKLITIYTIIYKFMQAICKFQM